MADALQDLFALAREARREGRFTEAAARYEELLRREPENLAARIERAAALSQGGRVEEAAAAIAEVLAEVPDHPGARMEAGFIARAQGRHDDELRHFEAAAARDAESWRALIEVAQAACAAGQLPRALEAARKATELAPASAAAWIARARAARALGDPAGEETALRRAAEADPADAAPLMELANAALRAGDGRAALALVDEAGRRSPEAPLLDVLRGHAALAAGEESMALDAFRRGVKRNPAVLGAATGLIHCLLRLRAHAEAAEAIEQARRCFGDHPELAAQEAALLEAQGRASEARAVLRAAYLAAGTGRFPLWEGWSRLELRIGTAEEQAACIRAARPATPAEQAAVALAEGLSAEARLDWAEAGRAFERARALAPGDAAALDGLARLAALHLRHGEALDLLKRHAAAEAALRAREGRSRNPSQSTTGQIALEFRLDREGSAALRDILPLPPHERITPLMEAARTLPGSTAIALWLLISLRQAGRLDEGLPPAAAPAIPRRLLWLRPRDAVAGPAWAATWKAMNPDLEVTEMDGRAAAAYLSARYGPEGRRAWLRTPEPAVRADLLRLAWLADGGGWTVAAGARAVAPLARLGGGAGFVAAQEGWGAPGMTLLGAAAGNDVAARAADLAISAIARGDAEHPWLRCGPGLLARALASSLAATPDGIAQLRLLPEREVNGMVHRGEVRDWQLAGF